MVVLFLGRNTENILAEARQKLNLETEETLVVTRNNDRMEIPSGLTAVKVSEFRPIEGVSYTVIGNGGTTAQLVPVLKELVEFKADFQVIDLQRDGHNRLW